MDFLFGYGSIINTASRHSTGATALAVIAEIKVRAACASFTWLLTLTLINYV